MVKQINGQNVGDVVGKVELVPAPYEMWAFDQFGPFSRQVILNSPISFLALPSYNRIKTDRPELIPFLNIPEVDIGMAKLIRDFIKKEVSKNRDPHDVELGFKPLETTNKPSLDTIRDRRRMERVMVRLKR